MVRDWTPLETRKPTREDSVDNCVLWWHVYNGVMISGYNGWQINRFFTHWMTPPEKPKDAPTVEEYWRRAGNAYMAERERERDGFLYGRKDRQNGSDRADDGSARQML